MHTIGRANLLVYSVREMFYIIKKQKWIIIIQYDFRSIRGQEEKLRILYVVRFDLKTIRQKISDVVKGAARAAAEEPPSRSGNWAAERRPHQNAQSGIR